MEVLNSEDARHAFDSVEESSESSFDEAEQDDEFVKYPQPDRKLQLLHMPESAKVGEYAYKKIDQPDMLRAESLNHTDSTGVTQAQPEKRVASKSANDEELNEGEGEVKEKKKRKKKSIYNKRVVFYVKDARYEVIKRVGKKEFNWRNTYKDEEDCNMIWSDIGLQPERLQNMKQFQ